MGPYDEEIEKSLINIKIDLPKKENKPKYLGYLDGYYEKQVIERKTTIRNGSILHPEHYHASDVSLKKYNSSEDTVVPQQKWPTDALNDFLYDIDEFQDPTYLGYDILFISDESALFNFDKGREVGQNNTALSFIDKYSNIPAIENRRQFLTSFLEQITQFFSVSTDSENIIKTNKRHYIEMISGLEKLSSKIVEYEKDFIEITLTEDVSLRTQGMIELYNNLVYDYNNKRTMLPENTLRFDMIIKISDIRDLKIPTFNSDGKIVGDAFAKSKVMNGGTHMLYELHDCNFIFDDSQTHAQAITMAGSSSFNVGDKNNMKFKIKYKSISKVFESQLINSETIVNINSHNLGKIHADDDNSFSELINNIDYTRHNSILDGDLAKAVNIHEDPNNLNKDSDETIFEKAKAGISDAFSNTVKTGIKSGKQILTSKFNLIRGNLINDVIGDIRDKTKVVKIYPTNVHGEDFLETSLTTFAKGLGTDFLGEVLNENAIYEATSLKNLRNK